MQEIIDHSLAVHSSCLLVRCCIDIVLIRYHLEPFVNSEEKNPSSDSFLRFLEIVSLLLSDADLSTGTLASCLSWILVPGEYLNSRYWCLRNTKVPKIVDKEKSQKCEMQVALTQGRSCHHNHNCRCCWESILFRVL